MIHTPTLRQMSKNTPDYLLLESLCHLWARWWLGTGCHEQHTREKDDFQQGLPGQGAGLVWRWAGLWKKMKKKRNIKKAGFLHTPGLRLRNRVLLQNIQQKMLQEFSHNQILTFKKLIRTVQLMEPCRRANRYSGQLATTAKQSHCHKSSMIKKSQPESA